MKEIGDLFMSLKLKMNSKDYKLDSDEVFLKPE